MGFYFTGYSLFPLSKDRLQKLLSDNQERTPGDFYLRFFESKNFPAVFEKLKKIICSEEFKKGLKPISLSPEECAVFFDQVRCFQGVESLSDALEVCRYVKPLVQDWMPTILQSEEAAHNMFSGGAWGFKGEAPFEFGYLTREALSVQNWSDVILHREEYDEIIQNPAGMILTDTLGISFSQARKALEDELKGETDPIVIVIPEYIELIYDDKNESADIPSKA